MEHLDEIARRSLSKPSKVAKATTLATPPPRAPSCPSSVPSCAIYRHKGGWVSAPHSRPSLSPLEKDEQEAFVMWLRRNNIPHHSIPNSAARSAAQGAELKKQGLVPGVPDMYVFIPGANIAIELKRECGILGDVDPMQWYWHEMLAKQPGWHTCIAFGKKAAVDFVEAVRRYVDEGVQIAT